MKNKEIPFYWHVKDLKLVNYYRYTSRVVDSFIELEYDEKDEHPNTFKWFMDLRKKVESTKILIENGTERLRCWDNKIVIECQLSTGNTIYVGYYDRNMRIGLGVNSDDWVKPYPFIH